jgi:hypothetical protein
MDFNSAKQLGACLARDYAEDMFRLLVNYQDISASEAASRLNLHIRTAQDFLETLADVGVLAKEEVFERKRPYFRYSLVRNEIILEIDLGTLFNDNPADTQMGLSIREKKGSGASFKTARAGNQIASLTTWTGKGRDRKSRRIYLTTSQGRFLYHLPFPTAKALPVEAIMKKAKVTQEHFGEINDLVRVLEEHQVIESFA